MLLCTVNRVDLQIKGVIWKYPLVELYLNKYLRSSINYKYICASAICLKAVIPIYLLNLYLIHYLCKYSHIWAKHKLILWTSLKLKI